MSREDVSRRRYLTMAGTAGAATILAGCSGDGGTTPGTDTTSAGAETTSADDNMDTTTERPEPETREGYLQRANRLAHNQAPWIFLNRQYSVYGKSTDIDWEARVDETIEGYEISPATDAGQDVVITQSQMDTGLDPQDHRETPTDNIVRQAYEGLYERDREGTVEARLATDFNRIEEGRIEFTIRDGVSFHNGDDLTPADVAFSINRIVQEDVGGLASPQSDQLSGVTGAEVSSEADRTVEVQSDGLNPIVFSLFASYCDIMDQSWVEENDSSYINQNMNGTGAFQLANYEQGVQVEFESFGGYWREEADIDTLTITAAEESSTRVNRLLSGEADIVVNVPPQDVGRVQDEDSTSISAVPSTRIIYNAMRFDVEPFDSPEFRRAMNYAIDLEGIVQNVLQTFGDATGQPTLEGFVGHNQDVGPYPQDVERAEQLVEDSGYAGAEITLNTPVGRYLKDVEIAQAVADQINQLSNVTADVEQREFSSLVDELLTGSIEDKPPWYLIGWGNTTFDASQTIIPLLTSDGVLTSWKNDEFDRLVNEAQSRPGGN